LPDLRSGITKAYENLRRSIPDRLPLLSGHKYGTMVTCLQKSFISRFDQVNAKFVQMYFDVSFCGVSVACQRISTDS